MRESTKAEGAATFDDLEGFSDGLICLTGGEEGPLAAALSRGGEDCALKALDRLASIYGRNHLYVNCSDIMSARKSRACFAACSCFSDGTGR